MNRTATEAVILDHDERPRHYGPLPMATHEAEGYDPLCGDRYTLRMSVSDGRVHAAGFEGFGCAVSKASASILCERLNGLPVAEAVSLVRRVDSAFSGAGESDDIGDMEWLLPIREQPSRVKCALLAWRTVASVLQGVDG